MAAMLRAPFRVASLSHCKDFLKVKWQDGAVSQFPSVWLRNSVRDPNVFDAQTFIHQQKDFARFITKDSTILHADNKPDSEDVMVDWEDHRTAFNASWLRARDLANSKQLSAGNPNLVMWDASDKLSITYDFAERREKLYSWMNDLRKYGIAFFKGVPPNEKGLQELLETVGQVMQRSHPVNVLTIKVDNSNIEDIDVHIYTAKAHPVHNDTSYYPIPARISGLLASQYSAPAGAADTLNFFVDSVKVIEDIRKEDPEAYELLSTLPVRLSRRRMTLQEPCEPQRVRVYNYESMTKTPIIGYDADEERPMLRFTNKQCGIDMDSFKDQATMKRFYEAFLLLESKLNDPRYHQSLVLREGWCALFNNYRVTHGRGPIDPSTKRTLMLSFLDDTTWRSRWRIMHGNKSNLDSKWLYGCSEKELEILANRCVSDNQ
ncbi:hypothetical protein QZH41_003893 [Actinostola sp. cb2023]|nr:hypothetical protein QZH41_003893 [Actinostola sp. cb2023]